MTVTTPEWTKHAIFYQIFPDRFARVDSKTLFGKAKIVQNGANAEVTVDARRGVVLKG